jgi:hypothetical protein
MNTDLHRKRMLEAPDEEQFPHKELTEQIIGCAFEVYNHLGYGYLEKVYKRDCKLSYFGMVLWLSSNVG